MTPTEPAIGPAGLRDAAAPAHRNPGEHAVRAAVARLEAAAAGLRAVLVAPAAHAAARAAGASEPAGRAALDEELCDRLVDLAAARAWAARETALAPAAEPGDDAAAAVLRGCALWAVEADTLRVSAMTGTAPPASGTDGAADGAATTAGQVTGGSVPAAVRAHTRAAALVTALASGPLYDAVCAGLRAALGSRPTGRAAAAWDMADTALSGLDATRGEWVDADPAHSSAGGWVLVDRIGRLTLAVALLSSARELPAAQTELRVNAARRHTWNHLRQPPPEAATALHLRRTAELVDWIAGTATRSGT
ncbi:hypothetical protein [Streptomyces sp. NPDC003456]|uniref:hypothetical protein n=1 Tax=Streptomyces sp. NPDC003456 TaxID=3364683 RepID=UPI0036A6307C